MSRAKWAVVAIAAIASVATCGRVIAQEAAPAAESEVRVYVSDIHDFAETQKPGATGITIVAARNGTFSGKAVVRSDAAIESLSARVSDLKHGDATIPASAVQVRYAVPWGEMRRAPRGNDILLENPPGSHPAGGRGGATAPVWITVRVPKDARAGDYAGQLAIGLKGGSTFKLPVSVRVADWTVPDTNDWRTWVEIIQSPDTLAVEYGVPLWSDKHFQMIGESMRLIGDVGSRVVYVPLIARTNQGNAESMVRWVKKGDGSYDYDFTAMDRYLDTAQREMGTPKLVIFYVWELYLKTPTEDQATIKEEDAEFTKWEKQFVQARYALKGKGPAVTVLNRATGETTTEHLPRYTDPEAKALWQPLFDALRKRMASRGLGQAMMLGMVSDHWPTKEETQFFKDITGDLPWASCSHHARWIEGGSRYAKAELYDVARVGYTSIALGYQFSINPAVSRGYGWQKPVLHAQYWRFGYFNDARLSTVRTEAEANITGSQRGIGHLGGDMWFAVRDNRGRPSQSVVDRMPESYWHSLNIYGWLLGRGPEGPTGTARYEAFREGVQGCEARILIETALADEAQTAKLGADLAGRARALLDERQRAIWKGRGAREEDFKLGLITGYREFSKFITRGSPWNGEAGHQWFLEGWQHRDAELFATAGEVQRKLRN